MRLTKDKARRAMGNFGHRRLTSTTSSIIRVVKIKPSTTEWPIRVKLKTVDCRTAKYTALSYAYETDADNGLTAGTSTDDSTRKSTSSGSRAESSKMILCDGKPTRVNKAVWDVLYQLQRLNSDALIWIDSLCINFESREERAAQVNMMSYIYGHATHVIVWLGRKTKATDDTLFCMRKIVNAIDWRKIPPNFAADFRDPVTYARFGMDKISIQQWSNIYNFCHAKWFSRLWGFYELSSARQAMFLIGDSYMDYEFLMDFAMVLDLTGWLDTLTQMATEGEDDEFMGLTRMLGPVATLRDIPHWHPWHSNHVLWMKTEFDLNTEEERAWKFFELLLQNCERFECYDPRDRIFGPLAFVKKVFAGKPINKSWPIVDYATSIEVIYSHFSSTIQKHTREPSILSTAGYQNAQRPPSRPVQSRGRSERRIPLD